MSIKGTFLDRIIQDKKKWIIQRKIKQPLNTFQKKIKPTVRNFYNALNSTKTVFILECKKSSPSNGIMRENFDLEKIIDVYSRYASVISVVTDEKYFHGDFKFLSMVSGKVIQPVLCKDFIIDTYQVYLARYYQADAILLMLSVLTDEQYHKLALVSHSMNMGVLTEISNQCELERAITLRAKVVGINNRDLRDLSINLNRTIQLAPRLKACVTVISESGISNHAQVRKLSTFVNGFLIGTALMKNKDLDTAVRGILIGHNKICGLTRSEDAYNAYKAGAVYGGIIFAKNSPRKVNQIQAQKIIASAPLKYVGVFQNNNIDEIIKLVKDLHFTAIQLHGNENQKFISQLRDLLPKDIEIWKAFSIIKGSVPVLNWSYVDRYVFDNGQGGTNQSFDWSILKGLNLSNVFLAGGLNINNCLEAVKLGCAGLDFNSGIEISPGIKDNNQIKAVFRILNSY